MRFVSYEISKQLKEKGFKEPCLACYDGSEMLSTYSTLFEPKNYNVGGGKNTSAPLYQEVVDWFRDKHSIDVYAKRILLKPHSSFIGIVNDSENKVYECYPNIDRGVYEAGTYYESLNKAIEEAIILIN